MMANKAVIDSTAAMPLIPGGDRAQGVSRTQEKPRGKACASSRRTRMREETDHKIMRATLQIAASQGVGAVTIEEVARRSGVAKTTIYRRYRNTNDMLLNVQAHELPGSPELSGLTPTRANLVLLLEHVAQRFSSEIGISALGMALTSHNGFFGQIAERITTPVESLFRDFFIGAEQSGVLRKNADVGFLFNTIIGSMAASQALHRENEHDWALHMADLLWRSLAA
ncbi:MAG: TetR/AcrR family transcriptional regulator [Bifidobacterium sp.]|jgi:AcrR family transcriptional regulator|nr:TetR/AcrR family transcriptional regulator [Bifidobacterium sp.]MCI1864920.1 TetR/AcrR family transcriptional regulator [Bifidobacterium sp.]